ncbi:MAG: FAD-binding oxidoreductase [Chloroflexi bacterium]|nr:FAD-binding oxidoreductase [Chloroflexota bacterium]MBP8056534.1 FAD-binding oxidoreductase [Chloroflexota bacterium]
MMTFNPVTPEILTQLTAIVGANGLTTASVERQLRAKDQSYQPPHLAEVVIWPETSAQVAAILRLAHEALIPVTPWGVGTSLEGNPIPLCGGICLSTERMNRIVALHVDDFQVTVQPGVPYKDLNKYLAPHGLFFPPDPGANATIGGMLANNAAGIRTVRYGASKDNVLQMQVAMADGRLIQVGSRSIKQASGYDLLHLFVGSEGTLGVITEATLKLTPVPNLMSAVVAGFSHVNAAVQTVVAVRGSGVGVAALEFIDANNARMLSQEPGVKLGEQPTLFMELHATHHETLEAELAMVREICVEMGAVSFRATTDNAERMHLWHARHAAFEIAVRNHPGKEWVVMDVAVPISVYPAMVGYVEEALAEHGVIGYLIGHAGDGNLHLLLPFGDAAAYTQAMCANEAIVHKAIALGGTATGEHGVGVGKAKFMPYEHGAALEVMWVIKQALDPQGILNPGKIFPA